MRWGVMFTETRCRPERADTSWNASLVLADPPREGQSTPVQKQDQEERDKEPGDPDGRRVAGAPFLEEQRQQLDHSEPRPSRPVAGQVSGVSSCSRVMQL